MTEGIAVALIAAGASIFSAICTIIVVIISNKNANAKQQKQFEVSQEIMKKDIEELTREVREHNNFARRMPVVEEKINVINHRIADLESFHKGA